MLPEANSGAYCLFSPFLQTVSDSPPLSPRFFANFSRRRDKERKRERRGGGGEERRSKITAILTNRMRVYSLEVLK